ncbi:hypothetical protein DDF62_11265 [Caulobacter radicis]|uniref:hypothetical protein n=1 Tax=Caulobacter radicis TaxID=2172650 RepID=UPI000D570CFF|nr:hypothetical protein [Caulobacter radicis]PVM89680.1 hypothetical protein DDF62_11265 [Caulobacter radicis]
MTAKRTPQAKPSSHRSKGRPGTKAEVVAAPVARPAVFVHSSFRTASTWLWTRFRGNANTVAYCEIFHEILAGLTLDEIPRIGPSSWRSRHPASSPYFIEFFDLLGPGGGVQGFSKSMPFEWFVPRDGVLGDLTDDEVAYVGRLIDNAASSSRTAVLTDTRTLGRAVGMKRRFGGLHIFIYRNLFQQWCSYSSQHRDGNRYFIDSIKNSIEYSEHVEFFRKIKYFLSVQNQVDSEDWLTRCSYDDVFVAFMALHIYLYLVAYAELDLPIDVNRLAGDKAYRQEIEQRIASQAGVEVDLSDAITTIEAPLKPLEDPKGVAFKIDTFLRHALEDLRPTAEAEAFVRGLIRDMWDEHARFTFYTRSLFAASAQAVDRSAEEAALKRAEALEAELDGVRSAAEQMVGEVLKRNQVLNAEQADEIDRLQGLLSDQGRENNVLADRLVAIESELRHELKFSERLNENIAVLEQAFQRIRDELVVRGDVDGAGAAPRADLPNDAGAKLLALVSAVDDAAGVLVRERQALQAAGERQTRDQGRIVRLIERRQVMIEQRDALLDLVEKMETRNRLARALLTREPVGVDGVSRSF